MITSREVTLTFNYLIINQLLWFRGDGLDHRTLHHGFTSNLGLGHLLSLLMHVPITCTDYMYRLHVPITCTDYMYHFTPVCPTNVYKDDLFSNSLMFQFIHNVVLSYVISTIIDFLTFL